MADAIRSEAKTRREYADMRALDTMYYGGGTPSVLSEEVFTRLHGYLMGLFEWNKGAEITVEVNPEDITATYLKALQSMEVNRLSMGIQSFHDDELKFLNRSHSAGTAADAVKRAQDAGFENITIDLMYALPSSSVQKWKDTLARAIDLNVPHISAYCLTIEPKTVFGNWTQKGRLLPPGDDVAQLHYGEMCAVLSAAGYEHYEVSNFARNKLYSRHNTSYWHGEHYLGLGPSAHSYDGNSRQWNISSNPEFIRRIRSGEQAFVRELLSRENKMNEYLLTRLRTMWGLEREVVKREFGDDIWVLWASLVSEGVERGWVIRQDERIRLTEEGMLMADQVITELMVSPE